MTNLGVLGGTFDPIHLGHTLPAMVVAEYLSLDKVLFIPANVPPHKATPNVSAKQRATMVELACSTEPLFQCDERELTRDGHSYTIDTLKELAQLYPHTRIFFIIGLDSLLTFTTWHKYQEILSLCHLVVNTRPNYQLTSLNQATQTLLTLHQVDSADALKNSHAGGIFLMSNAITNSPSNDENQPHIDISSSEVRQQLANKLDCQAILSAKVLDFIHKNKLYR